MSADIEWVRSNPEEFRRKLQDPKLFGGPVRKFLTSAALIIQGWARQLAPKDRGHLAQSVTYEVDSSPLPVWAKIGTNQGMKALAMEYGTGSLSDNPAKVAGWQFPTGPELETWARRHGFDSGATVAAIIRKRGGLAPRAYLRNAMKQGEPKIRSLLRTLARDIQQAWSK